ncbi:MAG: pilus assembly protein PilM [Candidatus Omnitrophica bacterium]|nr:pilus assembly protein PilM [Candidatus Omnitrophota bacterium]
MRLAPLPPFVQSGWQLLKHLATVKPQAPKATIGLDIGSSSVKAVALGPRIGSGMRPLLAQQDVPLTEMTDASVQAAVQQAVGALGVPLKTVNLSVSGQSVIMRVVEMPKLAPQEFAQALPFEAQRYLPFTIQDVVLDGVALGATDGQKLQVLIVACRRDFLERRVAWIRQSGLEPGVIDVDALANVNAWMDRRADGQARSGTHAVANLGAQWANLAIVKDGQPFLVRDIPWGAAHLVKQMAEHLGRQESAIRAHLAQASSALAPELVEAMRSGCEALAADLQLSFDFFENHFGTPPDRVALSGGLVRCPGFLEALSQHLAQPLTAWEPREGLASDMAVAYGLALRTDAG